VTPLTGKVVEIPLSRKRELQQIQGVEEVSVYVEEKVFLNYNGKNDIAYIKGVDADYQNIIATDSITFYGNWLGSTDAQVVVGAAIADELSLTVNNYSDYLQIMVPKPGKNAINMMNYKNSFSQINVLVSDLFSVNENLDSNYIFSTITAARTLLHLDEDSASGVAIKLSSDANESSVRTAITAIMGDDIIIKNKLQLNDALYKMLNSENLAVYLIFTLVLIIALFNVIGSIIMMILDKKKNLKTLLDLGASIKDLRKVFFIQGSLMTITGGIIGLLIGITIVSIQLHFKLIYIAPELPYPFAMRFSNIIVALGTIAILTSTRSCMVGFSRCVPCSKKCFTSLKNHG